MASVKVKFRPSIIEGKTGTLYLQVIHRRIVRSQKTKYKSIPTNGTHVPHASHHLLPDRTGIPYYPATDMKSNRICSV